MRANVLQHARQLILLALVVAYAAPASAVTNTAKQGGSSTTWNNPNGWTNSNPAANTTFPNNGNAGFNFDVVLPNNGVTVTLTQDITIDALTQNGDTIAGANNLT